MYFFGTSKSVDIEKIINDRIIAKSQHHQKNIALTHSCLISVLLCEIGIPFAPNEPKLEGLRPISEYSLLKSNTHSSTSLAKRG